MAVGFELLRHGGAVGRGKRVCRVVQIQTAAGIDAGVGGADGQSAVAVDVQITGHAHAEAGAGKRIVAVQHQR